MKYSSERNVIERVFQFLKGRWAILRGNLYYPAQTQCQTIVACCVLHNLINREMNNIEMTNDLNEGDSSYTTIRGEMNNSETIDDLDEGVYASNALYVYCIMMLTIC